MPALGVGCVASKQLVADEGKTLVLPGLNVFANTVAACLLLNEITKLLSASADFVTDLDTASEGMQTECA